MMEETANQPAVTQPENQPTFRRRWPKALLLKAETGTKPVRVKCRNLTLHYFKSLVEIHRNAHD
jgi:hypothetical protein